jgi:FkbM family methyltransferase
LGAGIAGNDVQSIKFSVSNDLDVSGVYGNDAPNRREVRSFRIDDIVKDETGSLLIKLDTHGYEIPIFEGALKALKKTEVLIVEVYGFHVSSTGLLFHNLSSYLEVTWLSPF